MMSGPHTSNLLFPQSAPPVVTGAVTAASRRMAWKALRLAEVVAVRVHLIRRFALAMEDGFHPRVTYRERVCLLGGPAPLVGAPNANRPVVTR